MARADHDWETSGIVPDARQLLKIAKHACANLPAEAGDLDRVGYPAAVAVIFSAMAVEGFINEVEAVAAAAAYSMGFHKEPAVIAVLAATLADLEESRVSVETKYAVSFLILTGKAYVRGKSPYQDFALLMELRNALLHPKPHRFLRRGSSDAPELKLITSPVIRRLRDRNVLVPGGYPEFPLLARVCTRAAAQWALRATEGIVRSIIDVIPSGQCREILKRNGVYAELPVIGPVKGRA
jgi:hypothetical protein